MRAVSYWVSCPHCALLLSFATNLRNLQEHALRKLNVVVDTAWAEASEHVAEIEALAEDEGFGAQQLAASVASKVSSAAGHLGPCKLPPLDNCCTMQRTLRSTPHRSTTTWKSTLRPCASHLPLGHTLISAAAASTPRPSFVSAPYSALTAPQMLCAPQHYAAGIALPTPPPSLAARCIDQYTAQRTAPASEAAVPIDERLEAVFDRVFARCLADGALRQGLGIALEARRLDAVSAALAGAATAAAAPAARSAAASRSGSGGGSEAATLQYVLDAVLAPGAGGGGDGRRFTRAFRSEVVRAVAARYAAAPDVVRLSAATGAIVPAGATGAGRDYLALARCMQALRDAEGTAAMLTTLIARGDAEVGTEAATADAEPPAGTVAATASDYALVALQLAWDVAQSGDSAFATAVLAAMPMPRGPAAATAAGGAAAAAAEPAPAAADATPTASSSSSLSLATGHPPLLRRVRSVLDGTLPAALALDFTSRASMLDPLLLKAMKGGAPDARASVLHAAVLTAHGYMAAGTGGDAFLRSNLDWLGKATNWAKFSATATQGVIHRGATPAASMRLLEAYLPREGAETGSAYAEGGALYALGLIHAGRGTLQDVAAEADAAAGAPVDGPSVISYLVSALRGTVNEVLQHGAALGVGLAALGSGRDDIYASLRDVLLQDSAVAGEAAALGIGCLLVGRGPAWASSTTGETAVTELLAYAHETQHEKAIRGIAVGAALSVVGLEEGGDGVIAALTRDSDPLLRYGGAFATALAYVGTGSNAAVRALLHTAVTDVSDDVRRAAVMGLGFVLCRTPGELPPLLAQLTESYNPHVRYGAALALGIGCAGGASSAPGDAVALLEPLLDDAADFVRQGALLALGLILAQEAEGHLPRAAALRQRALAMSLDRHQTSLTRMGAHLALGLLDIGGRNAVVSLVGSSGAARGAVRVNSAVGLVLWLQYWYWFPLLHTITLALTPTALVGLTLEHEMPAAFAPTCECPPSWFAYPPPRVEAKVDRSAAVTVVELSVAAKARAKAAAKAKSKAAAEGANAAAVAASAAAAAPVAAAPAAVDEDVAMAGTTATAAAAADGTTSAVPAAPAPAEAAPAAAGGGEAPAAATAASATAAPAAPAEPDSFVIANPSRVTPGQAKFVTPGAPGQRYVPLRSVRSRRVLFVRGVAIAEHTDSRRRFHPHPSPTPLTNTPHQHPSPTPLTNTWYHPFYATATAGRWPALRRRNAARHAAGGRAAASVADACDPTAAAAWRGTRRYAGAARSGAVRVDDRRLRLSPGSPSIARRQNGTW